MKARTIGKASLALLALCGFLGIFVLSLTTDTMPENSVTAVVPVKTDIEHADSEGWFRLSSPSYIKLP